MPTSGSQQPCSVFVAAHYKFIIKIFLIKTTNKYIHCNLTLLNCSATCHLYQHVKLNVCVHVHTYIHEQYVCVLLYIHVLYAVPCTWVVQPRYTWCTHVM